MKYVLLAIIVLFAAQPSQASLCDMIDAGNVNHSQHDSPIYDDHGQDMDCCDQNPSMPSGNCGSMSNCGVCPAGVVVINTVTSNEVLKSGCRSILSDTGEPLSRFNSPPFRPPIS